MSRWFNYRGITGYIGPMGSGKTYLMTRYGLAALRAGREVWTNAGYEIVDKKTGRRSHTYMSLQEMLIAPPGTLLMLDEAGTFMSSRSWTELPRGVMYRLGHARKDSLELVYSGQNEMQIDVALRRQTSQVWYVKRIGPIGIANRYPPIDFAKAGEGSTGSQWFFLRKKVMESYDTKARVWVPPEVLDALRTDAGAWVPLTDEVMQQLRDHVEEMRSEWRKVEAAARADGDDGDETVASRRPAAPLDGTEDPELPGPLVGDPVSLSGPLTHPTNGAAGRRRGGHPSGNGKTPAPAKSKKVDKAGPPAKSKRQRADEIGGLGEEMTAAALKPLLNGAGFRLLENLDGGEVGNIDHVLIGPNGVWVIESKHYPKASIEITESGKLKIGEKYRTQDWFWQSIKAARAVRNVVDLKSSMVRPVVVVHGDPPLDGVGRFGPRGGIPVAGAAGIVDVVSSAPSTLDDSAIAKLEKSIKSKLARKSGR